MSPKRPCLLGTGRAATNPRPPPGQLDFRVKGAWAAGYPVSAGAAVPRDRHFRGRSPGHGAASLRCRRTRDALPSSAASLVPAPSPGKQHPHAPSGLGRNPEPAIDPPRFIPDSGPYVEPSDPASALPRLAVDLTRGSSSPRLRFPFAPRLSSLLTRAFPPLAWPALNLSSAQPDPMSSPIPLLPGPLGSDPFRGVAALNNAFSSPSALEVPTLSSLHADTCYLYESRRHRPALRPAPTPSPHIPTGSSPLHSAPFPALSSHPPSSNRVLTLPHLCGRSGPFSFELILVPDCEEVTCLSGKHKPLQELGLKAQEGCSVVTSPCRPLLDPGRIGAWWQDFSCGVWSRACKQRCGAVRHH